MPVNKLGKLGVLITRREWMTGQNVRMARQLVREAADMLAWTYQVLV
jgi:hypothetical protein